jgi:hypothetical protein
LTRSQWLSHEEFKLLGLLRSITNVIFDNYVRKRKGWFMEERQSQVQIFNERMSVHACYILRIQTRDIKERYLRQREAEAERDVNKEKIQRQTETKRECVCVCVFLCVCDGESEFVCETDNVCETETEKETDTAIEDRGQGRKETGRSRRGETERW